MKGYKKFGSATHLSIGPHTRINRKGTRANFGGVKLHAHKSAHIKIASMKTMAHKGHAPKMGGHSRAGHVKVPNSMHSMRPGKGRYNHPGELKPHVPAGEFAPHAHTGLFLRHSGMTPKAHARAAGASGNKLNKKLTRIVSASKPKRSRVRVRI